MSKLDEAAERLQAAVSALEAAARARQAAAASGPDAKTLAEMKSRTETLEARNAEIAGRLDNAIGRIRAILDD